MNRREQRDKQTCRQRARKIARFFGTAAECQVMERREQVNRVYRSVAIRFSNKANCGTLIGIAEAVLRIG